MRRWQLGDWTGRTALVTGGSSGIGLQTARALAHAGADVTIACRDVERARSAVPGSQVQHLDLGDLDSVQAHPVPVRLDALVCNAGLMAGPYLASPQGHERQIATNHFGHAALIARLWPALEAAGGRVVLVSSIAARGGQLTPRTTVDELTFPQPYGPQAYATSKQANLAHALELHRRTTAVGSAVTVTAAHPGVSNTQLFSRLQADSGHPRLAPLMRAVGAVLFSTPRAGARHTLRALVAPAGSFVGPRLLMQTRGRPHLLEPYAGAADPGTGARLWELTEQVLGHPLMGTAPTP